MTPEEAKRKRAILQGKVHLYVPDSRSLIRYVTRQKKSFFKYWIRRLGFYKNKDKWISELKLKLYTETKPAITVIYLHMRMILVGTEAEKSNEVARKWMFDANIVGPEYENNISELEVGEWDDMISLEARRVWKYALYDYLTTNKSWTVTFTKVSYPT